MKQLTGKEFAKILSAHGWKLKRVSGSHHIFTKAGRRERIVVTIHGKRILKTGLLRAQMKHAGLTEADL